MSRFTITETKLAGLKRIDRNPLVDERGFLARLFCTTDLAAAGWPGSVAQVNHTLTRAAGTVRGMHFQHPPHGETKLVSCIRGNVFDVAIDLRAGSPTFLQVHTEGLSATNHRALLIPEGFAHGFQALSDDCELVYMHSNAHVPDAEDGLHPQDPRVGIDWPLPIAALSPRDGNRRFISSDFPGLSA